MSYEGYNAYLLVNNKSNRNKSIAHSKKVISSTFFDSPNYYQVQTFIPSTPLSSTPLDVWIVDDSKVREQKQIQVHPDQQLEVGSLHLWKDDYWLTTIIDENLGDVYSRGTIIKCQSSLKWLDNGIVREAWFALRTDTPSNFGVEDGRVLVMPNERRHILIQANEYTWKVKKGQRFIFDENTWHVITVDRLKTGIISLVLEEHQFDESRDNAELRIADYYNNLHVYSLRITNGDTADVLTSETIQLNVEILDNGQVATMPIIYTSSNESIATVNESGLITAISEGSVTITAKLQNDETVMDSIVINVTSVVTDNYSIVINGSDAIKQGQSLTYSVTITNNGIVDNTKTVTWTLLNDAETGITDLASIVSNTETECVIKGLKYNDPLTNSYFKLRAVCVQDGSIVATKRIQARGVF